MTRTFWMALLIVCVGLSLAAIPVQACSGFFRETTLREQVDSADVVVVGTVIERYYDGSGVMKQSLYVERSYKGSPPNVITIKGYDGGAYDCHHGLLNDAHGVFFLDQDEDVFEGSYIVWRDAYEAATPEMLAELTRIVGYEPLLRDPIPLSTRFYMATQSIYLQSAIMCVFLLVQTALLFALPLFFIRLFKQRRAKAKNMAKTLGPNAYKKL